jgi:exopolysaccharide production protein ExoZ
MAPQPQLIAAPNSFTSRIGDGLSRLYESPPSRGRIVPMEGLRGLAVLLVFFVHLYALLGSQLPVGSSLQRVGAILGTIGNSGVDLFFIMSGYLIYGALIRREVPYVTFMRRRVQRIFPTFLVVLFIYLCIGFVRPQYSKIPHDFASAAWYLVANVVLLPGVFNIEPIITVAWSLSFEFFFYLSVPLLVAFLFMRSWSRISRIVFFAVMSCGFLALPNAWVSGNHSRFLSFLAGIILYETAIASSSPTTQTKRVLLNIFSTCAALAGIFVNYLLQLGVFSPNVRAVYSILPLAIGFYCLSFAAFTSNGFLAQMFSWAPIRYLGNMSYSYYLIHGLVLNIFTVIATKLMHVSLLNFIPLALFGFLSTWIGATILFAFIEKPYSILTAGSKAAPAATATPAVRVTSAAASSSPSVD